MTAQAAYAEQRRCAGAKCHRRASGVLCASFIQSRIELASFRREIFALSNGLGFLNINRPSLGYRDRYPLLLVLRKLKNPADGVCKRYVEPIRCLCFEGTAVREKVDVGFATAVKAPRSRP
jgi:hypothetical protein